MSPVRSALVFALIASGSAVAGMAALLVWPAYTWLSDANLTVGGFAMWQWLKWKEERKLAERRARPRAKIWG